MEEDLTGVLLQKAKLMAMVCLVDRVAPLRWPSYPSLSFFCVFFLFSLPLSITLSGSLGFFLGLLTLCFFG
jgi:hypothetical protein